ncbi:hypothetical protein INT44_009086 [Umbelopsis vinacea]|uniref:Uncharacterized protein n=1 Tax=Umbelopsis vinacea TaxID=44442 RepID=A0A8H7UFQ6_9FUNG|nr:hypothetical protein INT44_009086 [Umbelopsis vinacea]
MFSKASTSSWKNEASTLELSNQYTESSRQAEKSTFRSANNLAQPSPAVNSEWSDFNSNLQGRIPFTPELPRYNTEENSINDLTNPDDSILIHELLQSREYTDAVYSPSPSQPYIPNAPIPSQQSNHYLANLIEAEDIEKYLSQTTYTDDVYSLPVFFQQLIREAKEEIAENKSNSDDTEHVQIALSRLRMVRDHILSQNGGDVKKASSLQNLNVDDLESFWNHR